ncbi:MAG: patatin-like phospholipase family protein, partial [Pseudomonadales bacterium]
ASMSLPGLFPPRRYNDEWHVDGGLVNPVPISLCHALGANFIIAVNLNGDIVGKHFVTSEEKTPAESESLTQRLSNLTLEYAGSLFPSNDDAAADQPPGVINTIAAAINITQDRITRSRMAGDPPDILLTPRLAHIGLLELYRAPEAIEEGRHSVKRMLSQLEHIAK